MAMFKDIIQDINGWLKVLAEFGLSLILVFVLIDILFPGTTGIVNNLAKIVESFAKEGIVGLIALLIFLLIYRR